jgi:hypothetical protein
MPITLIDANTAVNLEAIATIHWTGSDEQLAAYVQFLTPGLAGEPTQYDGAAARRLYEIAGGQPTSAAYVQSEPSEVQPDEVPFPLTFTPQVPAFTRNKGWYYLKHSDGRGYFLAFVNAKGNSSMRTFDANSGRFIRKQYANPRGSYLTAFGEIIKNAQELTIREQPNLEVECRERLPEPLLSNLKSQIA